MLGKMLLPLLAAVCLFQDQGPLPQRAEIKMDPGAAYLGNGLRAEFKFYTEYEKINSAHASIACLHHCRGKKHLVHEECDTSCDETCPMGHLQYVVTADFMPENDAINPYARMMSLGASENAAYGVQRRMFEKIYQHRHDHDVTFKWACWNQTPCSYQLRLPRFNEYQVSVGMTVSKEAVDADGKQTVTKVDEFSFRIGTFLVPTDKFVEAKPYVYCNCRVINEIDDGGDFEKPKAKTAGGGGGANDGGQTGGGSTGGGSTGGGSKGSPPPDAGDPPVPPIELPPPDSPFSPPSGPGFPPLIFPGPSMGKDGGDGGIGQGVMDQFNLVVSLEDMNQGTVTATNPFPKEMFIFIPAGTTVDTDEDGVQDCMIIRDAMLDMPAADFRFPYPLGEVTKPIRVMCMEMSKGEPTKATKFRLSPTADPVIQRIGRQINQSRIVGPWDQAKVWIYTDGATYADIQQKLIPPPSRARYARGLFELYQAGADFSSPKLKTCVEPGLLCDFVSDDATRWLAFKVLEDPARLESWSRRGAADMAKLLAADALAGSVKHFVRVVNILASSDVPAGHRAAVAIMSAVPEASRAKLAGAFQTPFWMLCLSNDKAVSEPALKLLEAWNPKDKAFILANVPKAP